MPVQIRIAVNEGVIETFHIGRLTKNGMDEDSINEYAVVNQEPEPTNAQWDAAPRFLHRYGDSITTLGLEAVNRHQQYINDLEGNEDASILPVPLTQLVRVAKTRAV